MDFRAKDSGLFGPSDSPSVFPETSSLFGSCPAGFAGGGSCRPGSAGADIGAATQDCILSAASRMEQPSMSATRSSELPPTFPPRAAVQDLEWHDQAPPAPLSSAAINDCL